MIGVFHAIDRAARGVLLAAALVAFGSPAYAQQPSAAAIATAKELVAVTGITNLFQALIPGVIEQAKGVFLQQNPALAKDVNEIGANLRTELEPRIGELSTEMAKLYASRFSEQDLKEVLAFYKSPVGQKLILEQPRVIDAGMHFAQDWANKLSEVVIARMRDELKKRGHPM
jgi:hypothetical protein